jgi:gluconolactonase
LTPVANRNIFDRMETNRMARTLPLLSIVFALSCAHKPVPPEYVRELNNNTNPPIVARNASGTLGTIDRLDPRLDQLLAPDAKLEILVEGVDWCEGPVWRDGALYFSDVKQNTIYLWRPKFGVSPYLKPSGYLQTTPRGGEPGSNGLTLDHRGHIVMCQHGERRVARLERSSQTVLADRYQGKRFNSPNDLCFDSKGNLYFTDPPYGLEKQNQDPKKELDFNGIYLLRTSGELVRTPADVKFPNGLALSPDEKTLYVCVSDPANPVIMRYDVQPDGNIAGGKVFFDTSAFFAKKLPGLPDGLKVDTQGNLWATGPGGVLILSPQGQHLGTIATGQPTANCAWGDDGSTLYVCANHNLCRIKTKAKGIMPGPR